MTRGRDTTIFCSGRRHDLRGESDHVLHMEMVEHVTPVPNAPRCVEGVVFSRGEVVPVINLRARFGFEQAAWTSGRA